MYENHKFSLKKRLKVDIILNIKKYCFSILANSYIKNYSQGQAFFACKMVVGWNNIDNRNYLK